MKKFENFLFWGFWSEFCLYARQMPISWTSMILSRTWATILEALLLITGRYRTSMKHSTGQAGKWSGMEIWTNILVIYSSFRLHQMQCIRETDTTLLRAVGRSSISRALTLDPGLVARRRKLIVRYGLSRNWEQRDSNSESIKSDDLDGDKLPKC